MSAYDAVVADGAFDRSRARFESVVSGLAEARFDGSTHAAVEEWLSVRGREVMLALFQDRADLSAVRESRRGDVVGVGEDRVRSRVEGGHVRTLTTVFGQARVERLAYRAVGAVNLYPADAVWNLPTGEHSHGMRKIAVVESVRGSFDQAVAAIVRCTGVGVGKRQVQAMAAATAVDIEAFYRVRASQPCPDTDVLVLTCDGKGIVMRRDGLRADTAKKAAGTRTKLATRLSRGEKTNRKRMAEVGAVYDITPAIRTPQDIITIPGISSSDGGVRRPGPVAAGKWLTASVEHDAKAVIATVFEEAERRDPAHRRTWIALVDGNDHQIRRIQAEATRRQVTVTIICDFIHILERLWTAAWCFFGEGDTMIEVWVAEHAARILAGHAGITAAAIRRKATTNRLTPTQRRNADTSAKYLMTLRPYLRYDQALAAGWPIATGIIEGACRYLVKDRMDLTGARRGLPGAEAILNLRALISNGDFNTYWPFHLHREQQRTHLNRYRPDFTLAA